MSDVSEMTIWSLLRSHVCNQPVQELPVHSVYLQSADCSCSIFQLKIFFTCLQQPINFIWLLSASLYIHMTRNFPTYPIFLFALKWLTFLENSVCNTCHYQSDFTGNTSMRIGNVCCFRIIIIIDCYKSYSQLEILWIYWSTSICSLPNREQVFYNDTVGFPLFHHLGHAWKPGRLKSVPEKPSSLNVST